MAFSALGAGPGTPEDPIALWPPLKRLARQDVERGLRRDGFMEVPGSTEKAQIYSRAIIERMGSMTEAELSALYDELWERERADDSRPKHTTRKAKPKANASPFQVIEGGAGHA